MNDAKPSNAGITIGRLATETGVHLETIRYYQRLGLMPMPDGREVRCAVIPAMRWSGSDSSGRAQGLGFSLGEVKLLLELATGYHCVKTRTLAQRKLSIVEEKIAELRRIEAALQKLIRACGTGNRGHGCPIIDKLSSARRSGRNGSPRG